MKITVEHLQGVMVGYIAGLSVAASINAHLEKKYANQNNLPEQIWSDACKFLLEKADDQTKAELEERMDYWRVVVGVPIDLDTP